ncbi:MULTISPECIES: helix-turn-helix transcriptional regulator [Streptomycetaceae]|uniref:helix-turn-helix domain-containing protein n=1 Tax=unclassified Streptomyces TaxID=2593676 RepID=UPI0033FDD767
MAPGHVAYGLGAQYGLRTTAETVMAWERGVALPDERELTALSGVLWCAPEELLAAASTLREHRLSREVEVEDLARTLGMTAAAYRRIEDSGRWRGNERQAVALCRTLEMSAAQFLTATGRNEELAELLNKAVATRWQAYVKPVAKIVPLDRVLVQNVLEQMHTDYQALIVSTQAWNSAGRERTEAESEAREFLLRVVERFWRTAGI